MARKDESREVLRRKKRGQRKRLLRLDLSGGRFSLPKSLDNRLPEPLAYARNLQHLDLSKNLLPSLPEALARLRQLRGLDVSRNKLTALPECLGQLKQLRLLDLSHNELTVLPDWLVNLRQLQALNLSGNRLLVLPEWLNGLVRLSVLHVTDCSLQSFPSQLPPRLSHIVIGGNSLCKLPEALGDLVSLESLSVCGAGVTAIPDWIGNLRGLKRLSFVETGIRNIPESVAKLDQLKFLRVAGNGSGCVCPLQQLPDGVGELSQLTQLALHYCQLTDLPTSIAKLGQLKVLGLAGNPLNPGLAAAYRNGVASVKAYLRERAKGTRQRYEAKLLILGDGDAGKTCVSRALRGLPFKEDLDTTRGVDVDPWTFQHPDQADLLKRRITLNIWDFEGQEINHQTHQFFLSTDSLYVLVFRCREQFLLERAEYWLDAIRSRVPGAQVAIVIAECEQRTPYVPEDRLLAEYGDLLSGDRWLFPVGCADGSGIPELRQELQRRAADLQFMGRDWPATYDEAENQLGALAKTASHVTRQELHRVFKDSKIDEVGYDEAARSMARLGVLTEFPDCPDLNDFIVLQPQWLTKAISHIMEDAQLARDKGEIGFVRMKHVWRKQQQESLFAVFHNCMKEFELCYDLEDCKDRCMVPLRFGYLKPHIPWAENRNLKTRRVTYKLNLRPPMGLMSRFIVKTHHMIVRPGEDRQALHRSRGVYWHNGVFLQSGEGPLLSQALCEFDPDSRTLTVEVRAAFPQKMLDQVDAYICAVFAFFQGLEPVRSYGCIRVCDDMQTEIPCPAVHSERKILFALQNQRQLACEDGWHDVDPMRLITGLVSFGSDIRTVIRQEGEYTRQYIDEKARWTESLIRHIGTLLGWADQNQKILRRLEDQRADLVPEIRQALESKLREYLGHVSDMFDERRRKSAPCVFSIGTQDGRPWNVKTYFAKTHVLTPWCECDGRMHRHVLGQVFFTRDKQWWNMAAPWVARATRMLATGLQLAFAGVPLALDDEAYGLIKNEVAFMKELSTHLALSEESHVSDAGALLAAREDLRGEQLLDMRSCDRKAVRTRASLIRFLKELAPIQFEAGQWGELRRTRMPDNSYRWLCEQHAREVRR